MTIFLSGLLHALTSVVKLVSCARAAKARDSAKPAAMMRHVSLFNSPSMFTSAI